jgi:hypothetical protein
MIPYFAVAAIVIVGAAIFDPDELLVDTEDLLFDPFEEDDGLNSTGFGGSP